MEYIKALEDFLLEKIEINIDDMPIEEDMFEPGTKVKCKSTGEIGEILNFSEDTQEVVIKIQSGDEKTVLVNDIEELTGQQDKDPAVQDPPKLTPEPEANPPEQQ